MTAEGDNSVLMQKVAKERMAVFKPQTLGQEKAVDLKDVASLHFLLQKREDLSFMQLAKKLQAAGKEGEFTHALLFSRTEKSIVNCCVTSILQRQTDLQAHLQLLFLFEVSLTRGCTRRATISRPLPERLVKDW
jgi:hypothetical protein